MKTWLLIALGFVLFAGEAALGDSGALETRTDAVSAAAGVPELRFERLADGVWMHTSFKDVPPWGAIPTNGLIVTSGRSAAILVDTAWNDAQTAEVLAWVEQTLGRAVTSAVLTHAHDDKMGGVGTLRAAAVRTYAHAESNRFAPARGLVAAEFDLVIDSDGEAKRDTAAFSELTIFYPGAGHTVDNIVVNIDSARVLFGGCLIRPGRSFSLGNTADAVVNNWAAAVERVRQRFPKTEIVVPSHGSAAGPELLGHTMELAKAAEASDVP